MKKALLSIALGLAFCQAVWSIPAPRGNWSMITLTDGTKIRAELRGDEFVSFMQSEDGRVFTASQKLDDGTYVYAETTLNKVSAIGYHHREEAQLLRQQVIEKIQMNSAALSRANGPAKIPIGSTHEPFIGTKKCLCILVEFSDVKFKNSPDEIRRLVNERNFRNPERGDIGSVRDYFYEQSRGLLDIQFDVVGPVSLPKTQAYYGGDQGDYYHDLNVQEMIRGAIQGAKASVNFKDYDWDGDGFCEPIFVLYAGHGQADHRVEGSEDLVWPHKGNLNQYMYYNGTYISDYACGNELAPYKDDLLNGIGTLCHEYSHCLGLPDLYDISYTNSGFFGKWSIMEEGNYNSSARIPAGYTAYERMYAGWLNPIELTDATEITGMKSLGNDGETYIIYNGRNKNEYYLLENRGDSRWDSAIPGSGLIISHIDFSRNAWQYNIVNDVVDYPLMNDHYRASIVRCDGTINGAAYPSANSALLNQTNPEFKLFQRGPDNSLFMNKSIYHIKKAADGTISFKFLPENLTAKQKPEDAIFYESFDNCFAAGGNDGILDPAGTIALTTDNTGYQTTTGAAYAGFQCGRYGKSSARAQVRLPIMELDGDYELSFLAMPYKNEAKKIQLSVTGGSPSPVVEKKEFALTEGEWVECKTKLSAKYNKVNIVIYSDAKRCFLDEIMIRKYDPNGIEDVSAAITTQNARLYNLNGQRVNGNVHGIVIMNGKKVVK